MMMDHGVMVDLVEVVLDGVHRHGGGGGGFSGGGTGGSSH